MSNFSTIGSTTTGDHCTFPLMSLNSLAPVFLPHYQSSSDPPISLCNSTTMSLCLAQLCCRMPPQIIPSPAPPTNQSITGSTCILTLIWPKKSIQTGCSSSLTTSWIFIFLVVTSPTSVELSPGYSQDHLTVQPTLQGGPIRSEDLTTYRPSTSEWLRITEILAFLFSWNNFHQWNCR